MFTKLKQRIITRLFNYLNFKYLPEIQSAAMINLDYLQKRNSDKNTKVIYTCLTGGYDVLPLHEYLNSSWDYICFTDNKKLLNMKQYGAWKIKPLIFDELDNQLNNRWHKTHPHILFPDYEESIYIDSNISILTDWYENEINSKNQNIVIPTHYKNDCIYDEIKCVMKFIVKHGKEKKENVLRMKSFLEDNHFVKHYGLTENNFIYRKHNDNEIIKIMEEWWFFIKNYTRRDQLSLSYVFWKNNLKIKDISISNLRFNPNFRFYGHK